MLASPLAAQATPVRRLTGAPMEFAEPFSDLSHLVELADGRLVAHDAIERRLVLVDLAAGTARTIAAQGAGPREYRMITGALRAAGDSVLLWDPGNDRILALSPEGSAVGAWPSEGRTPRGTALARSQPRAADAGGRWYALQRRVTDGDTSVLVRVTPATARADTLARFATPQLRPTRTAEGVVRVQATGFPALDAWGVFADGRVMVIDGATYTPTLILPDGTRRRAAAIPFTPVPLTAPMRDAHLREAARELQRRLFREAGGGRAVTLPHVEPVPPASWPAHLPPLGDQMVRVDSRQRAWVRVTEPSAALGDRYDLLDREGRRVDAVRLPPGVRLVAMGRGVLYAVAEDDDGLLRLQRFDLP